MVGSTLQIFYRNLKTRLCPSRPDSHTAFATSTRSVPQDFMLDISQVVVSLGCHLLPAHFSLKNFRHECGYIGPSISTLLLLLLLYEIDLIFYFKNPCMVAWSTLKIPCKNFLKHNILHNLTTVSLAFADPALSAL